MNKSVHISNFNIVSTFTSHENARRKNSVFVVFLLPSVARQHTILNTRWFLQSPLDPVFRAIYVLSKSRSCVCLSGFRISGEIISFKYLNYFEGGGRESFSIAHACFLREQDEKSRTRFFKNNDGRYSEKLGRYGFISFCVYTSRR